MHVVIWMPRQWAWQQVRYLTPSRQLTSSTSHHCGRLFTTNWFLSTSWILSEPKYCHCVYLHSTMYTQIYFHAHRPQHLNLYLEYLYLDKSKPAWGCGSCLPLNTFGYLWLPLVSFPYLSSLFLSCGYLWLCFLALRFHNFLTFPYLSLHFFTFPYLSLSFLIFPYLSSYWAAFAKIKNKNK